MKVTKDLLESVGDLSKVSGETCDKLIDELKKDEKERPILDNMLNVLNKNRTKKVDEPVDNDKTDIQADEHSNGTIISGLIRTEEK